MTHSFNDILEQVYELEGLLLLAESRGIDDIDARMRYLIAKKGNEVATMIGSSFGEASDAVTGVVEHTGIFDDPIVEQIEEPEEYATPEVTDIPDYGDPVEAPEPDDYGDDSTEGPLDDECDTEFDDNDDEPLTVDEALQRNMSRDLRKAFSLNDRFRYRRELFANNDVEMNDTLNLVETMHSYSEAEEFFYGDLEWDKEAPEVIDFMNVIRNHFYNRKPQP